MLEIYLESVTQISARTEVGSKWVIPALFERLYKAEHSMADMHRRGEATNIHAERKTWYSPWSKPSS